MDESFINKRKEKIDVIEDIIAFDKLKKKKQRNVEDKLKKPWIKT